MRCVDASATLLDHFLDGKLYCVLQHFRSEGLPHVANHQSIRLVHGHPIHLAADRGSTIYTPHAG